MSVTILIPARYESGRFPGKPLAMLKGADGISKSLIHRSWDVAMAVPGVDAVYVVTDDERIQAAANAFGAKVLMTSSECRNGTERCAEAVQSYNIDSQIVINLQGDAPLTPVWFVEALIAAMRNDASAQMTTPVLRCDRETYENFLDDRRNGRVGGTTAVFNHAMQALYFSKEVIPFTGHLPATAEIPVFHHVGVYGYRPKALTAYGSWDIGPLEQLEGLEQLRFLENGVPISCVEVEARGRVFWELNNPVDVERIESVLAREAQV
jgi:3-deoxy-manno-octulosonate cytidylyltransferase (CMP-KDO synthetase)